ncbi:hypothetical protein ACIG47_24915 [Promicromonospora sp. NPDC052451]|uniref:hypothetical protein n=1 Tax=Promicromonospora sp. NPDC052451 TaxID=3364407 RepID=UPI0037C7272D
MTSAAVRRAHVARAALFREPAISVWSRFETLDDLSTLADLVEVTPRDPPGSRLVRFGGNRFGAVESITRRESGLVAYQARVPGGSARDDLDGVVRVSAEPDGYSRVTWSAELVSDNGQEARDHVGAWLERRLQLAGGTLLAPLTMEIWLGGARTATLVAGARDAVLVDAPSATVEAEDLAAWIRSTGKQLTGVIVLPGGSTPGLRTVLRAFPEAGVVAAPAVTGLDLEGHELRLFDLGEIAGRRAAFVSVRDLDAAFCGDLVSNGVRARLEGVDAAARRAWNRSLDLLQALRPAWTVTRHRAPGTRSDATGPQVASLRRDLTSLDTEPTL